MNNFIKNNIKTISANNSTIYYQNLPYLIGSNNYANNNKINDRNDQLNTKNKNIDANTILPSISSNNTGIKYNNINKINKPKISNGNSKSPNNKKQKSTEKQYNSRYIANFSLTNRK